MTDQLKPTPQVRALAEQVDRLTDDNAALLADNVRIAQQRDELDATLRESNAATLRWMEAAGKLDADNHRLRDLLRRVAEAASSDDCGSIGPELLEEINAIGRTLPAKTSDNRLLELLADYRHRLDKRWREGTRMDAYARGHLDGLEAAEVIFDEVFNIERQQLGA